jgi:Flp pilus assembly protein TadD
LKSLSIKSENTVILNILASIYYNNSEYNEAEKYLLKSYNLVKSDNTIRKLALVNSYKNNHKNTIKYYKELSELNKNDLMNLVIMLFLDKNYTDIITEYKKHYTNDSVLS